MAKEKRQRVRFTGKRTGLSAINVPGIGLIEVGDTVEVDEDEAERWTALLPMRDAKEGSDFVKVGGVYSLEPGEAATRRLMQREKFAPDPEEVLSAETNTAPAHASDEDSGTVEEQAKELRTPDPITDDRAFDIKGKRGKKAE